MSEAMLGSASSEVAFSAGPALDSVARNASDAFSSTLMAARSKPEWVREVCERLDSFLGLQANWDSFGANQPSAASIEMAKLFLHEIGKLVGVDRPDVGISPAGNVALAWELAEGKRNLDIEVLGTGVIRFAYIDEQDESADRQGTANPYEIAVLLTQW